MLSTCRSCCVRMIQREPKDRKIENVIIGRKIVFNGKQRRWLLPLAVAICILITDQISKHWIVQELGPTPLTKSISLIGDWSRLVYSQNTGVAFNLFPGMSTIFIITSLLISAGAIYIYWVHLPNHNVLIQLSIGLILGGALGNTVDRILVGYVIDFIQVGWWPVFNVADSAITTGAILLALYLLLADLRR
jgi:signal peptidase II